MSDTSAPLLSSAQLLEKTEKLLNLFHEFHEDFDLLRSVFAPRPTSTQRPLFNEISHATDIKLVILRDMILTLIDSLEEAGLGKDGGQHEEFYTLKAQVEDKIRRTWKLRKTIEGVEGCEYNVGTPRFKVIGNRVESTGDGRPNAEQQPASQVDAVTGKYKEEVDQDQDNGKGVERNSEDPKEEVEKRSRGRPVLSRPPQAMKGTMTIRDRLLQDGKRSTLGGRSLDASRSTSPTPPSPALPVDRLKLITVRGSASMFPGALQKAREVLKAVGTQEGALLSRSPTKVDKKLASSSSALKDVRVSSPTPIPSSPQLPPHWPNHKRVNISATKSPAPSQNDKRRQRNRMVIPSSDDDDTEERSDQANQGMEVGGRQATEQRKKGQPADSKTNHPSMPGAIKTRESGQQSTGSKTGGLRLSFRTPVAASIPMKRKASSSYDVYAVPGSDEDHDVIPKKREKGKDVPAQVVKQEAEASAKPTLSNHHRHPNDDNSISRPEKKSSAKVPIQPNTAEKRKLGLQSPSKNKLNRLSYGAKEDARVTKRQKTSEKESGSQGKWLARRVVRKESSSQGGWFRRHPSLRSDDPVKKMGPKEIERVGRDSEMGKKGGRKAMRSG
ncbi:uncharacterized protein PAC_18990 [Phialocephala subalpina]|uniref:Uncharacterized protein n=1 Tax=Phialocephala subalpina TaxID=576137 RepID=A0A1L7XVS3_9HELO|nr:uncharacterized protein PAC_18990 [Phialocephala subalpina]